MEGGEEAVGVVNLVYMLLKGIHPLTGEHLAEARALLKPGLADLL